MPILMGAPLVPEPVEVFEATFEDEELSDEPELPHEASIAEAAGSATPAASSSRSKARRDKERESERLDIWEKEGRKKQSLAAAEKQNERAAFQEASFSSVFWVNFGLTECFGSKVSRHKRPLLKFHQGARHVLR